ncbi:rCG44011, partial [Rattus norvegicus]
MYFLLKNCLDLFELTERLARKVGSPFPIPISDPSNFCLRVSSKTSYLGVRYTPQLCGTEERTAKPPKGRIRVSEKGIGGSSPGNYNGLSTVVQDICKDSSCWFYGSPAFPYPERFSNQSSSCASLLFY